ncbi:CHRD domain-containing protein [Methylocaldum szegediense]|uniref:CHRD domain-containing protein n=1 Tax=Methylocaldum szegediense TaxID=73780 RepID=A0ABN8X7Z0_9GAMM|nr:CHRD domain-containing protein [Methylocaldum szegediense]CAI8890237.1 CHRD domain-containing protein [Methylocaldum szegediense]
MMMRKKAISILLAGLFSGAVYSQQEQGPFVANLTGQDEVPPVESTVRGVGIFTLNQESTQLTYHLIVNQLQQAAEDGTRLTQAHLRCGQQGVAGPIVVDLLGAVRGGVAPPLEVRAVLSDANIIQEPDPNADNQTCADVLGTPITTLAELVQAIEAGNVYVNVHSEQNPTGEIRGQLTSITAGAQPPGEQPPGQQPSGEQPSGEQPSGEQPAGEQAPGEQPAQ